MSARLPSNTGPGGAAGALPETASETSRRLLAVATRVAESCPASIGSEIALTGSVARGLADEHSDIEMNVWAPELPSEADRLAWLRQTGAADVSLDDAPSQTGPVWADALYDAAWVEVGWQTIDDVRARIDAIVAGEVLAHRRLVLAEIVATAVPLRTEGLIAALKQRLADYPDVVRRRLVVESVGHWCVPSNRWALLRRGDGFTLAARLADDMHRVLRIVFALNRQWEPDWKWIRFRLGELRIKPDRLAERLDEVVAAMPTEQSIVLSRQLILDTLDLVPPTRDVDRARESLRRSLAERAP